MYYRTTAKENAYRVSLNNQSNECDEHAFVAIRVKDQNEKEASTVGLEPTTTRLKV